MKTIVLMFVLFSSVMFAQGVPSAPGIGETPPQPENLVAQSKTKNKEEVTPQAVAPQAVLSWSASTAGCPCTYNAYKGATAGSEVKIQANIAGTTFTDTNVVRGSTYFWYVTASNSVGESTASNEVSATIPGIPSAPSGLTVTVQ